MTTGVAELQYKNPETPAPAGPIARWWVAPMPLWLSCAACVAPLATIDLFLGFEAGSYYLFPLLHALFGIPVVLTWIGVRALWRDAVARKHDVEARPEHLRIIAGLMLAVVYVLAGPMPLGLGVIARWGGLESLRANVEQGAVPPGGLDLTPFQFTGAEAFGDQGVVILYTDGTAGAFPASGSGLIYVPGGVEFPGYNRGSDGWLFGSWYWFTTD